MTHSRLTAVAIALAAIGVLTTFTACDASAGGTGTNPTAAPSDDTSEATSLESVLLPLITEQMEQMQIPGLIVVVQTPDRGSYEVALGVADADTGKPMELDMHFRIGSNTKTMTATVPAFRVPGLAGTSTARCGTRSRVRPVRCFRWWMSPISTRRGGSARGRRSALPPTW